MMRKIEVIQTKDIQFKSMLSLTEYNKQKDKELAEWEKVKHLTGLSCPECLKQDKEVELHQDTDGEFLNNPPLIRVQCPECKFTGTKIA